MSVQVKLELETARVKSICFHQKRPWLIAAFHTGEVIIYDYEAGIDIQHYCGNSVPVRCASFHKIEPIFVTGDDNGSVKVFDYDKHCCIVTFGTSLGHKDYVRTVQFHDQKPFIVSAGDDHTIRIWNWKTREQVSIISGHNHYVMSAFFHPNLPFILSASLDDTIRVWDISGIFNEQSTGIFSLADAVVKFQQEEHTHGVNWAIFHDNNDMAVSCSDDQTVKLWRINDRNISLIATLRGHSQNVSCAAFHSSINVVVSVSEDKTLRVWDSLRFIQLYKLRRDNDRFWCVTAHPNLPLFAAGHDSGLILIRLNKISPTFDVYGDSIFYYKDEHIREYNIKNFSDGIVGDTKPMYNGPKSSPLDPLPRSFAYNHAQKALLVGHVEKFEIHLIDKQDAEVQVFNGHSPTWISRVQFAFLDDKPNKIFVREIKSQTTTQITVPNCKKIFSSVIGTLFIIDDDKVYHFDVMKQSIISSYQIPHPKRIYLSPNKDFVAIMTSSLIHITKLDFTNPVIVQETAKIKSGCWYENIFIYSTRTHIKYFLPSGDSGIIKSLISKTYICAVRKNFIISLSSDNIFTKTEVDLRECKFKAALAENKMSEVNSILRNSKLCSNSIIDFLDKHGHPETALQFATEPYQKLDLALRSYNIEVAVNIAQKLNDSSIWEEVADAAMLHGKFDIAEKALEKSGNTERLMFLYLISGQKQKLEQIKVDPSLMLQRAIWTNNREIESALLRDSAPILSYVAAKTSEAANVEIDSEIASKLDEFAIGDLEPIVIPDNKSIDQWPQLMRTQYAVASQYNNEINDDDDVEDKWSDDDIIDENQNGDNELNDDDDDWGPDDIEIPETDNNGLSFHIPPANKSIEQDWRNECHVPGQLAAAGFFYDAISELTTQICLVNAEPLKYHFISAYISAHSAIQTMPLIPNLTIPLQKEFGKRICPLPSLSIEKMNESIQTAITQTGKGQNQQAIDTLVQILQSIPLLSVSTKKDANEAKLMIETCTTYIIANKLVLESDSITSKNDPRKVECSAYSASLPLRPDIKRKFLIRATKTASNARCIKTAAYLGQQVENPTGEAGKRINQIINMPTKNDAIEINYHPFINFEVCCGDFIQLTRQVQKIICPYCKASYQKSFNGEICKICNLSQIGGEATGLQLGN